MEDLLAMSVDPMGQIAQVPNGAEVPTIPQSQTVTAQVESNLLVRPNILIVNAWDSPLPFSFIGYQSSLSADCPFAATTDGGHPFRVDMYYPDQGTNRPKLITVGGGYFQEAFYRLADSVGILDRKRIFPNLNHFYFPSLDAVDDYIKLRTPVNNVHFEMVSVSNTNTTMSGMVEQVEVFDVNDVHDFHSMNWSSIRTCPQGAPGVRRLAGDAFSMWSPPACINDDLGTPPGKGQYDHIIYSANAELTNFQHAACILPDDMGAGTGAWWTVLPDGFLPTEGYASAIRFSLPSNTGGAKVNPSTEPGKNVREADFGVLCIWPAYNETPPTITSIYGTSFTLGQEEVIVDLSMMYYRMPAAVFLVDLSYNKGADTPPEVFSVNIQLLSNRKFTSRNSFMWSSVRAIPPDAVLTVTTDTVLEGNSTSDKRGLAKGVIPPVSAMTLRAMRTTMVKARLNPDNPLAPFSNRAERESLMRWVTGTNTNEMVSRYGASKFTDFLKKVGRGIERYGPPIIGLASKFAASGEGKSTYGAVSVGKGRSRFLAAPYVPKLNKGGMGHGFM